MAPVHNAQAAFRVGISGIRKIEPNLHGKLCAELSSVLRLISETVRDLAAAPEEIGAFSKPGGVDRSIILRVVSPLAEGSERMAAELALSLGYSLYSPIPFSRSEYECDFPSTVEEFRQLLSRASVLQLDGSRDLAVDSYREVGRFVARNCDLLIAVWDGQKERSPGDTAEIVRFAANLNVPIWWIHPSGTQSARFVRNLRTLPTDSAEGLPDDAARLSKYIAKLLQPPKARDAEDVGLVRGFARSLGRKIASGDTPLDRFLREVPLRSRRLWRTYSFVIRTLTPAAVSRQKPSFAGPSPSSPDDWWVQFFAPIDGLANGYGERYRSSYVLIAALAFVAVLITTIGSLFSGHLRTLLTVAETSVVAAIACVLLANYYYKWHDRWLSYRLLAELLRKEATLWSVGRSLPLENLVEFNASPDEDHDPNDPREENWVAWYFAAIVRSAPPLTGALPARRREAAASIRALMEEQIKYHSWRATNSSAVSSTIAKIATLSFVGTAAIGLVKLGLISLGSPGSLDRTLGAIGVCLSALSGSFIGLRAYCDFSLLTQQSRQLVKVLRNTMSELDAIDLTEPTSAIQLGDIMSELSVSMMQDVTGWQQLFRLKSIGPGSVFRHFQHGSNK